MGGERSRKRQYVLFYPACFLTVLLLSGCAHVPVNLLADYQFSKANALMEEGDFEASLKENDEVFKRYPEVFGAQAFFNKGLIHAHPLNPERDYGKAAASFQMVLETFPKSPLKERAAIWAATVQGITDREKEIDRLNEQARMVEGKARLLEEKARMVEEKARLLEEKARLLDAERGDADRKIKALVDNGKRWEKETGLLRDRITELKTRISDLEMQMEMLKKVDLGIAEKKRKTLR